MIMKSCWIVGRKGGGDVVDDVDFVKSCCVLRGDYTVSDNVAGVNVAIGDII